LELSSFGGPVVYKVQLPKDLSIVQDMFHISQLKKCLRVPEHVIEISDVNHGTRFNLLGISHKGVGSKESGHSKDKGTWELEEYLDVNQ
jgi:hypothetical protein